MLDFSPMIPFVLIGLFVSAVLFITLPPAVFGIIAWMCQEPGSDHALTVWTWAQGVWFGFIISIIALETIKGWWKGRK